MSGLDGYTVYRQLRREGVALAASVPLGDGIAAALWERDETALTAYEEPTHHTLSLYVEGGEGIRRRGCRAADPGAGRLSLMPQGVSTEWDVSGPVRLFHLYVPRPAFERVAAETLNRPAASVALRDDTYFQDPFLERIIRTGVLTRDWTEPADRIALGQAAQALLAHLAGRLTRTEPVLRGGLSPAALRRVRERVEAGLEEALTIEDLAAAAGLSPFHFARMFKRATGESPHAYVLRRRIERARALLEGDLPIAEVALACGFGSQSHLTARFRAATGLTPGRYRAAAAPSPYRPRTA